MLTFFPSCSFVPAGRSNLANPLLTYKKPYPVLPSTHNKNTKFLSLPYFLKPFWTNLEGLSCSPMLSLIIWVTNLCISFGVCGVSAWTSEPWFEGAPGLPSPVGCLLVCYLLTGHPEELCLTKQEDVSSMLATTHTHTHTQRQYPETGWPASPCFSCWPQSSSWV
jgi:hypothetical protein